MLLIIFGNIPAFRQPSKDLGSLTYLEAYVPILIAFVIAILSINAMPAVLAGYRERGVLRRMATTPVGPSRVLAAQLMVNLVLAVGTLILILGVAWLAFGVRLPASRAGSRSRRSSPWPRCWLWGCSSRRWRRAGGAPTPSARCCSSR